MHSLIPFCHVLCSILFYTFGMFDGQITLTVAKIGGQHIKYTCLICKFNLWLLQMKQLNSANMHLYVIWYFIHVVWCTQGLAFTLLIQVSIFLLSFSFVFTIHVICTVHLTYSIWNKVFHTHPHFLSHHMKSMGVIVFEVFLYVHIYRKTLVCQMN